MVSPNGEVGNGAPGRSGVAPFLWLWALVALCCTGLLASCTTGNGQPAEGSDDTSAVYVPPKGATFVGSDKCADCHEDQVKGFAATLHSKKADPRTPAGKQGCESCHGPGSVHVDAGGGRGTMLAFGAKSAVGPREQSAQCLTCHSGFWPNWKQAKHANRDVTCANCHTAHKSTVRIQHQLKDEEPLVCAQCHKNVKADLAKQSHHPIREGKVECSNCHNPHGSPYAKNLRTAEPNELCYRCHTEKRGPYMWEHPPVLENCLNCHNPHGSNHNKLLVAQLPFLCQRCHGGNSRHPGTPYDSTKLFNGLWAPGSGGNVPTGPAIQAQGQACLNCHQNLHGSNHPSGKFFMR